MARLQILSFSPVFSRFSLFCRTGVVVVVIVVVFWRFSGERRQARVRRGARDARNSFSTPASRFSRSPEKREKETPVPRATILDRIKLNSKPPVFLPRCREKNLQD